MVVCAGSEEAWGEGSIIAGDVNVPLVETAAATAKTQFMHDEAHKKARNAEWRCITSLIYHLAQWHEVGKLEKNSPDFLSGASYVLEREERSYRSWGSNKARIKSHSNAILQS